MMPNTENTPLKIIVINLAKSKDRLKKILPQLDKAELEFEIFTATAGKDII